MNANIGWALSTAFALVAGCEATERAALDSQMQVAGASGAARADAVAIDSTWVEQVSHCGFSFHAPPGLREMREQGQDSCVASYEGLGCWYSGDYGPYGTSLSSFSNELGYLAEQVQVDGVSAVFVTAGPMDRPRPFVAALATQSTPPMLTFIAFCDRPEERDVAARVLRTVRFPEKAKP